jgi:hypothetical protein
MGGQVAREGVLVSHTLGSTPKGKVWLVKSEGLAIAIRVKRGMG